MDNMNFSNSYSSINFVKIRLRTEHKGFSKILETEKQILKTLIRTSISKN